MVKDNSKIIELSLIDRFRAGSSLGILRSVFINAGADPLSVAQSTDGLTSRVSLYLQSRKKVRVFEDRIKKLSLKGILVKSKTLYKKDWQNRWKEDFKPFTLTRNIEVIPAWRKKNYTPKKTRYIYIDTTYAFGSGLHETTRFMARLIESRSGKIEKFLDIGTGTGILSLVAFKSGVRYIRALDIQKESIRTSKENFALNGLSGARVKKADIAKLRGKKEFDFVAANLITYELIRLKNNIVSFVKPGGFLAVSGISKENFHHLTKAFKKLPLRPINVLKGKEWVAILYRRIK